MGMRPSANLNGRRRLRTWVKVVIIVIVAICLAIATRSFWCDSNQKTTAAPATTTEPSATTPPAPREFVAFDADFDGYWTAILANPKPLSKARAGYMAEHELVMIVGARKGADVPVAAPCMMPKGARVLEVNSVLDGRNETVAVEYVGVLQGSEGPALPGDCPVGSVFPTGGNVRFTKSV